MDRGDHLVRETELGRVTVSGDAVARIVGQVATETYGVVGLGGRRGLPRLRGRDRAPAGIDVDGRDDGLEIELTVVVEHGLNLAEVASAVRSRVAYEVGRRTELRVAAVEVRIDDVRRSG